MSYGFQKDITGTALKKILLKFVPKQFIKNENLSELGFDNPERLNDGGVELLQKLMDRATDDIRMYGTSKKLAMDLQEYQLFTSSHKYFGMNVTEEYPDMCLTYRSQKNEQFISKQDLLVLIKSLYSRTFANPTQLGRSMVMIYFKSCEEKLNGRLEFIKYDQTFFETFVSPSEEAFARDEERIRTIEKLPPFDELFQEWKDLLPGLTEEQYDLVSDTLKTHFKQFPVEGVGSSYSNIQTYSIAAFRCVQHLIMLQKKIASFPGFFLPNTSNAPIVVRLFEYNGKKFAMKTELNQAFASIDPSFKKWKTEELNGIVPVIYFEEIKRNFAHLLSKIHFIAVRIDMPSTNPPMPIITPSGSFCVFGRVASAYMLIYVCIVLKVYLKIGVEQYHLLMKFFEWHKKELSEDKLQHFMTMKKFEYVLKYTSLLYKELENVEAKHVVRDWDKEYTLNDLRSDLKNTGLAVMFPNIEDYAATVYEDTKIMYDLNQVKSSNMFTLIGLCQVSAILKFNSASFFNEISTFLNQKENLEPKSSPKVERAAPEHSQSKSNESSSKSPKDVVKNVSEEKTSEKSTEATDKMIGLKMKLNYSIEREKDLKKEMKQKESEYESEILRNKRTIEELKENAAKLEETIRGLSDSKVQLENQVSNWELKLKAERKKAKDSEKAAKQKEKELYQEFSVTESTYQKEISDNEKAITDLKSVEKTLNETIKMLSESNSQLTDKASNFEFQLKAEQQKTKKLEQTASAHQSKRKKEITETKRIINALNETSNQSASKIEQLESQFEVERDLKNSLEVELAKKNEAITELTNSQNQLIRRNEETESSLEREKQKVQELTQTMAPMLQRMDFGQIDVDLEKEISDINNVNSQLRETNSQLTGQVEQQNMVIKSFFNEFGQVQRSYSSSSCQTTPEEFTSGYTGVKHHLWSLQKIKDSFRKGHQLEQAREMMEKLSTQQAEIQEMAAYELQQYEAQLHHYLQSIEVNIQKIKKTGECTQLDPIPDLPMLSDRFLKEYWKHIDDKISKSEIPESSLEDLECLICFNEMTPEKRTIKCENCRKVLHSECASKWLKRHRSCPHCRRELLDPNEFPPLS